MGDARHYRGDEASEAAERGAKSDAWDEILERRDERKNADDVAAERWRQERLVSGGTWHRERPSFEQQQVLSQLLRISTTRLGTMGLTRLSACLAIEMAYRAKPSTRTAEAMNMLRFARRSAEEMNHGRP